MPRTFSLLPLLALFCALTPSAYARDWGFDRDTVYEWGGAATGRTRLVNGGAATLALDSVFAEQAGKPWGEISFDFATNTERLMRPSFPAAALSETLPAAATALLRSVDVVPTTCALKVAADSVLLSDTVTVRLRIRSKAGEEDTLMVTGTSCGRLSVGLRPFFAPVSPARRSEESPERDVLGRNAPPARHSPTRILPPSK